MITVDTWLIVDASLDNVISIRVWSGQFHDDDEVVLHAEALRERGWRVNETHPLRGLGPVGWPPLDAPFEIELDAADLAFIRAQLSAAITSTEQILSSHDLLPQLRTEQERSLAALRRAHALLGRRHRHPDN